MYNNETSLKILNLVVGEVSEETLQNVQQVIDEDKYRQCSELGYDLCGSYAPFCVYCDKSLSYPCANAYVKSLQEDNVQCAPVCEAPKKIRIAMLKRKKVEA